MFHKNFNRGSFDFRNDVDVPDPDGGEENYSTWSNRQAGMFPDPGRGSSEPVDPNNPETIFFDEREPTDEYFFRGTFLDPGSESFQPVNLDVTNCDEQPDEPKTEIPIEVMIVFNGHVHSMSPSGFLALAQTSQDIETGLSEVYNPEVPEDTLPFFGKNGANKRLVRTHIPKKDPWWLCRGRRGQFSKSERNFLRDKARQAELMAEAGCLSVLNLTN